MNVSPALPDHSPIGASSMPRWKTCPGSVRLSRGIVSETSVYAKEGIFGHEKAAERLEFKRWGIGLDAEMIEHLSVYVDAVEKDRFTDRDEKDLFLVEHKFHLKEIHPDLFGTADAVVYKAKKKKLIVHDLKYGAGISVNAEKNDQLLYYGLGALLSTGVPCTEVELVISQPRCPHKLGPVRRWALPAVEMIEFAADLAIYATRTEDPNAELVDGRHCWFCPAKSLCPRIREKSLERDFEMFKEPVVDPCEVNLFS